MLKEILGRKSTDDKPPDSFYFIVLTAAFTRDKFPCVCEEPGFLKMPGIGACKE